MLNGMNVHARHDLPTVRIVLHPRRILAIVDDACARAGVTPTRFGRDAVGDPSLVADLRAGRQPRLATRAAILAHVGRITTAAEASHA